MKKQLLLLLMMLLPMVASADDDMLSTPLTLEAIEAGEITFKNEAAGPVTYIVNRGEARIIDSKTSGVIVVNGNDKVEFFGNNATYYV